MWDKINKVKAQVVACMIVIIGSFILAFKAATLGIPESGQVLVNKVTDIALVAAVAWLFTLGNKSNVSDK